MKRPAAVGIVALLLVVACLALIGMKAKAPEQPRIVTATGSAIVGVDPDSARLFFEVSTSGKTPTAARKENAKRVDAVRTAILALKLPDVKTKSTSVYVSKKYGEPNNEDGPRPLIGYQVSHSFTILIKEPSVLRLNASASSVLDTALEHGVSESRSVSFFKEDTKEFERQAMTKAVENAIANARAFAKGAKFDVVKVAAIYGEGHDMLPSHFAGQQGQQGQFGGRNRDVGVGTSFLAGRSQITCTVQVACRF